MRAIRPVRQIAYFVPDAAKAARHHCALFGSGPYFLAENIPLTRVLHRGKEAQLDHSSAYGQWGEMMIEFVQQNDPGPSVFRDMYGDGQSGLHHVALIVDDLPATMRAFEEDGHETALFAEVAPGVAFAMMDCVRDLGHFVELYEPTERLLAVYDLVRKASIGWDGTDPIRSFPAPRGLS